MKKLPFTVVLADALHNASQREIRNESDVRYAKGIIVGVMAGVMGATGMAWSEAWPLVRELFPKDIDPRALPEGWN